MEVVPPTDARTLAKDDLDSPVDSGNHQDVSTAVGGAPNTNLICTYFWPCHSVSDGIRIVRDLEQRYKLASRLTGQMVAFTKPTMIVDQTVNGKR